MNKVYILQFTSFGFEEPTQGEVLGVFSTKENALDALEKFSMTDDDGTNATHIDEYTRGWGDEERGEVAKVRVYEIDKSLA